MPRLQEDCAPNPPSRKLRVAMNTAGYSTLNRRRYAHGPRRASVASPEVLLARSTGLATTVPVRFVRRVPRPSPRLALRHEQCNVLHSCRVLFVACHCRRLQVPTVRVCMCSDVSCTAAQHQGRSLPRVCGCHNPILEGRPSSWPSITTGIASQS